MTAKMIYLARRNPALARQDFPRRWRKHAASVGGNAPESLTEIRSTRYCHVRPFRELLPGSSDEYDGVALLRLQGLHSIPQMSRELVANDIAMADELRTFSSYVKDFAMFYAESVLLDGPYTPAAVLHFVRSSPGTSSSAFVDAWRAHGAAACASLSGSLRRYVQNDLAAPAPPGFGYDGVAEMWFDSVNDVTRVSGELERLAGEADAFIQRRSSVLLVTEVVMTWDPEA